MRLLGVKLMDKAVLYPTILQLFTALAPLLFFKFVFGRYTPAEIINLEILFVINAFFAVITNWSSTLFLSRVLLRFSKSGAVTTLLFNRALIVLGIIAILYLVQMLVDFKGWNPDLIFAICIILISQIFDSSFYYVGLKKLYIPQLQLMLQYGLALSLISFGADLFWSVALSWLIVTLCFFISILNKLNFSCVRFSLSKRIFKSFLMPTMSEVTTSIFSKLDVLFVANILSPTSAVIYILIRKHVLAAQSIIFASIRLLYLERNEESLRNIQSLIKMYIFVVCTVGVFAIYLSILLLFNYDLEFIEILALILFTAGIPLGYEKVRMQLQYAYKQGRFRLDLIATITVVISYILSFFVHLIIAV